MGRLYIFLLTSFIYFNVASQNEANNWYFGQGAGITFNSGAAVAVTNGLLYTLEGCSSISDASGNLLFYTDGRRVWNRNHLAMLNTSPAANFLKGDPSSSQSGIIIPKPGSTTSYYIFTVDMQGGLAALLDADGVSNGMMYSEVDMTAASGLGAVVLANKNISLADSTTEGMSAVKDANGIDYWVVSHGINNNSYLAYHITAAGVNSIPVVSNTGPIVAVSSGTPNFGAGAAGYMKISPDGKKIAACHYWENKEVVISDFDAATGIVSNSISTSINLDSTSEGPYGVEFSNCNEYLYVTEDFITMGTSSNVYPLRSIIWRFDLNAPDIIASKFLFRQVNNEIFGALQLAPDGKIYCTRWVRVGGSPATYSYNYGSSLHAINNPRLFTATFTNNAINLGGRTCTSGLPPFIASFFYNSSISARNLATGDSVLFCFGDSIQFRSNTSSYDSIRWNFNDTGSGIINNTSTIRNPSHLFSSGGNYQVTFLRYLCGIADTTRRNITITNYPVIPDLTNITVCSGTTALLDATSAPATSYLWNTGSTIPAITIDSAGKYVVTVSNSGCQARDSMFLIETISATAAVTISSDLTNTICEGSTVLFTANPDASLPTNGISYQWYVNGALLSGDTTAIYTSNQINNADTFAVVLTVDNSNTCLVGADTATNYFPMIVNPAPILSTVPNQIVCVGENTAPVNFNSSLSSTNFIWTNSNASIGLADSGVGNISAFPSSNGGLLSVTSTITVTPVKDGCNGPVQVFSYTINECSLPVELVEFAGRKIEDFVNNLYWITASEYNSDFFSLEHSQNIDLFKELYKVKSAGNSSKIQNYNYVHNDVPFGINYYRLKQVDLDGKYVYSNIIKIVNQNEKYTATVYPNPTTNNINIFINNPIGNSSIVIYDALGQTMHYQEIEENKNLTIDLNISHFANGIYYVKISDTKNETTIPLIKQ